MLSRSLLAHRHTLRSFSTRGKLALLGANQLYLAAFLHNKREEATLFHLDMGASYTYGSSSSLTSLPGK